MASSPSASAPPSAVAQPTRNSPSARKDPSGYLAAPLARDGDPESIALEETDTSFQIAWPGSYRLDGPAFVYTDRHSRRAILGYPTQLLAKD